MEFKEFQKALLACNIQLDEIRYKKLDLYFQMLIEKNKVMNLTAIIERKDVFIKHFLDSLMINCFYDMSKAKNLIDIGTGAGFPGIPVKIFFPEIRMVLLDSLQKRLNFLSDVVDQLELKDVTLLHGRAEDFAHDGKYRQKFDLVTSRAVANLSTLSELCLPYNKIGGSFISYKGPDSNEEIEKAKKSVFEMGGKVENVYSYQLPYSDIDRSMIVIHKKRNTPGIYPRKAGIPGKNPL